ncbi:fungal-specific transcription factor domain-containing protein [Geopyxis carbonaria]|nr:fungal-specific transcription factor domain-containing protein [Geopyxis carbonaria]
MYSSSSSQLPLDVAHQTSSGSSILPQHHPYNQQLQQSNRRSSFPNASPPNISQYSRSPMATFFVMPDGRHQSQNAKPPRRRRSAAGSEPVKHRRTRSGCFTCRMRRVKCDETHPVCERCQKGGRECNYPDVVPSTKSGSSSRRRDRTTGSREGSSSLEDVEEEEDDADYHDTRSPADGHRLKTSASLNHLRGANRRESWPSSSDQSRRSRNRKAGSSIDPSPSPHDPKSSAPTSPAESLRRTASHYSLTGQDWAHLPHDVSFYLNYHQKRLTYHHYLLKNDTCNFFKTTLYEHALNNEALLYALAAFSAFHYSVNFKTGAFQTFLEYYNKAVGLLRTSLDPGCERNVSTIITILQLASFEEYLGDWAHLMEHRNAASKIITSLWTPETMAETDELRMVYNWFSHFDVIAAMMAGHQTTVSSDWSLKNCEAVEAYSINNPDDIQAKVDAEICAFRDLAVEVSIMTAKRSQGALTMEEFARDSRALLDRCQSWYDSIDPVVLQGAEPVSLSHLPSDEVCPFTPAKLYKRERWPVNFLIGDYYGLMILLKHQLALTNNSGPEALLADYAIEICQVLAAMEAYPERPAGAILPAQAAIGLAALWIPDHPNYRRFMQRQLGHAEQQGFIYPLAFRTRMAELWKDPKLKHTWVVGDAETAMGLTIRQLVDERDAEVPADGARTDIREMRSLMTEMRLDSKGSGKLPPPDLPPDASERSPHMNQNSLLPSQKDDWE